MAADLEAELERLEEELKAALVERDPTDEKDVIVEVRQGVGGDEAAIWAGDVFRMLTRYAERRGFKTEILSANASESGGFKEVVFAVKGDGAYSVFKYEARHPPRPARARDRVPGPDPHLHRDGRGDAGGRGGRGRDRRERPADRRLPLDRPGRPVGQHDRLRRAHHPRADRRRRRDAGREVAAAEPAEGDARPPRAPLRARARAPARRARRPSASRRSAPASGPRRSAPTTSPRTGSPTIASSSPSTSSTRSSRASSTSSPRRSRREERRRLEAAGAEREREVAPAAAGHRTVGDVLRRSTE